MKNAKQYTDLSTGPTSLTGILTGNVVMEFRADKRIPPNFIGAGVAIAVGLMSLFMGLLNMGWVLDFVSLPILVGFMLAASLIAVQSQIAPLTGIVGVSNNFLSQPKELLMQSKTAEPLTIALGVGTIIVLALLQVVDTKLGKRHFMIHLFASSRYLFVLSTATAISYYVNRDRETPLWAVAGEPGKGFQSSGIPKPFGIALLVLMNAIPVFFATIVQHLALAKSFGRRHGYVVNASQELTFLGISNIASGIFGGMPVSAEISRTAVNESSDVKSPLSGIFTTIVVLFGLQVLKDAIFFIPQATIAGMIIVATGQCIPPFALMLAHWKGSFIDFLSCQITTQIAFLNRLDLGVGFASFFLIIYTMLRALFDRAETVDTSELDLKFGVGETKRGVVVQDGTKIYKCKDDVFYINSKRVVDSIFLGISKDFRRITDLRVGRGGRLWCEKKWDGDEGGVSVTRSGSTLHVLILDFSRVGFVDTSTMTYLLDLKEGIKTFAHEGSEVEMRFVGLSAAVKLRFERTGWKLVDGAAPAGGDGQDGDRYFDDMRCAVETPMMGRNSGNSEWDFAFGENEKEAVVTGRYVGF